MSKYFIILKDFIDKQSYKKLNPPWIKLYNNLLDDPHFLNLADHSRFHLLGLMLIASRLGNKIPAEDISLKHNLKASRSVDLQPLIDNGFIKIINNVGEEVNVDDLAKKRRTKCPDKFRRKEDAQVLFDEWKQIYKHPRAKLDDKRLRVIKKAFTFGYTLEDLKKAVNGLQWSKFHMGDNQHHRIYDSIELILRDAHHIDQFLVFYDQKMKPTTSYQTICPVCYETEHGSYPTGRQFLNQRCANHQ